MARLLLIDDDPGLLSEKVRTYSPPPHTSSRSPIRAQEGLQRVAAAPPDVILLDMRLPDKSGLEVYHKSAKLTPNPCRVYHPDQAADSAIKGMRQGPMITCSSLWTCTKLDRVVREAFGVGPVMPSRSL